MSQEICEPNSPYTKRLILAHRKVTTSTTLSNMPLDEQPKCRIKLSSTILHNRRKGLAIASKVSVGCLSALHIEGISPPPEAVHIAKNGGLQ